jgi:hypothetical protein
MPCHAVLPTCDPLGAFGSMDLVTHTHTYTADCRECAYDVHAYVFPTLVGYDSPKFGFGAHTYWRGGFRVIPYARSSRNGADICLSSRERERERDTNWSRARGVHSRSRKNRSTVLFLHRGSRIAHAQVSVGMFGKHTFTTHPKVKTTRQRLETETIDDQPHNHSPAVCT